MKTSLTIVSAKGQYEYCAAYLSEKNEFEKNVLLIIAYRGGAVAEQVLTSDSISIFDEIHIFEPVPDSTHGLNEKAMTRTVKEYLEFEKSVMQGYSFQALFWGPVTLLPIYNFLYQRLSQKYPKAQKIMMEDGTATYVLWSKRLFKYMVAPSDKKFKSVGAQLARKEIDFLSFLKVLLSKITGYMPRPCYGRYCKYDGNISFDVAIVKRKDIFKNPTFMPIGKVIEFSGGAAKPLPKSSSYLLDSKIPVLIDQNFGVPLAEHVKNLDKVFVEKKFKKVYIKPHPKERASYESLLQRLDTETEFLLIDVKGDAEEIVYAFDMGRVVGFNSTALFNLLEDVNVSFILDDYLRVLPLHFYPRFFPRIIFMATAYNDLIDVYSVNSRKIHISALRVRKWAGTPLFVYNKVCSKGSKLLNLVKKYLNQKVLIKIRKKGAASTSTIAIQKENFLKRFDADINQELLFFESFNGRYSCSPKAIFEAVVSDERYSDTQFVWAVSKELDEWSQYKLKSYPNMKLVIYGSAQYKDALSKAKVIVTNSRLPRYFVKKESQVVLQTWHGTPFKKDAMSILSSDQEELLKHRKVVNDADVSNYTYMLAQNEFSVECFKETFGIDRHPNVDIYNTGYPRNDRLVVEKDDKNIAVRLKEQFNLPLDKKIILFAPTWRDHHKKKSKAMGKYWDFDLWKEFLGASYHVIFRGHYFFKDSIKLSEYYGFITDLSGHNDINDLFLVSDILVTDYSSCMFDFSVLKRPIYFFMPDYRAYTHLSRRLHLDPFVELPGPVSESNSDLMKSIVNNEASNYQSEYLDFLERFNYMDDGRATSRALKLIESK